MSKTAKACCSLALLTCSRQSTLGAASLAFQKSIIVSRPSLGESGYFSQSFRSLVVVPPTTRSIPTSAITTTTTTYRSFSTTAAASHSSMAATTASNSNEISSVIAANINDVRQNIDKVSSNGDVRLVAVSKTKPIELLLDAYENGNQRVFGENYVQEIVEKVPQMPNDVEWHFIGSLQSNKANLLVKSVYPRKLVVETVSSMKLANKLNNAMLSAKQEEDNDKNNDRLDVYVQVNTSGEDSKSGVQPMGNDVIELCQQIVKNCDHLCLKGLMTIGAPGDTTCFDTLLECREKVSDAMGIPKTSLELSMGMSGDYEQAIEKGATNVRVGSTIFGARDYSNK